MRRTCRLAFAIVLGLALFCVVAADRDSDNVIDGLTENRTKPYPVTICDSRDKAG